MSFPDLVFSTAPIRESDADAIVLALPSTRRRRLPRTRGLARPQRRADRGRVHRRARHPSSACTRPRAPTARWPSWASGPIADAAAVRDAVGSGIRILTGFESVSVAVLVDDPSLWRAAAEGATLGGYRFEGYKSEAPKTRATRVIVHGDSEPEEAEVAAVVAAADAVALVKDLVSIPAEWLGPADFAERATAAVADLPVDGRGARRAGAARRRLRRHPRRRTGLRPAAPARATRLRARGRIAPRRPRRQGDHLRYGWSLAQARQFDGGHEVRHVRRRDRSERPARRRDARTAGARHRVAVHRRQHAVRPCHADRATCCACSTEPPWRFSTPMPRAGSCSPTASSPRAASIPT